MARSRPSLAALSQSCSTSSHSSTVTSKESMRSRIPSALRSARIWSAREGVDPTLDCLTVAPAGRVPGDRRDRNCPLEASGCPRKCVPTMPPSEADQSDAKGDRSSEESHDSRLASSPRIGSTRLSRLKRRSPHALSASDWDQYGGGTPHTRQCLMIAVDEYLCSSTYPASKEAG